MTPPPDQLPVRLTPLVGRQHELREVTEALSRSRLLTLTGPGGTGKTRLALALAGQARDRYAAGPCWVELAPVTDPALVAPAVAARLGAAETPGRAAVDTVAAHLTGRPALLVLDNCEHLTAAAAALAARLLTTCPTLTILATSREILGVDGERAWPVPPLSLPAAAQPDLAWSDAVALFEQRARLVSPSFRLGDDNAAAVTEVCRRLDGLPLAIELAAARMRMLSAGQLAERLDDIFAVLAGGARTAPRRHQTLRATLDWSHDLLDEHERAAFRRLAVFRGGFTLAAAEQVAAGTEVGGTDIPPGQVLDLLTRLADKSLIRVEHDGGPARYHLLSTVREYARERLAGAPDEEQARQAHLTYCVGLAEACEPRLERGTGPAGLERLLDQLDADLPSLRAAVEFATARGDTTAVLRIAASLSRFAYLRGHYQEIRQWINKVVRAGSPAPAGLRAKALAGSGRLALLQCDYASAARQLETARRLYQELDDPAGLGATLAALGSVARERGQYPQAMDLYARSLAAAEAAGDRRAIASARGYLGFAAWLQLDFGRATTECTAALAGFREAGDVEGTAWSLLSLGVVARYQGQPGPAAGLLAETRALSERIGFREGIAWSLEQLGLLAAEGGQPEAAALLSRSLELHRELNDRWRACSVLEDLAALALARGRPAQAASLLAAAEQARTAIGTVIAPCEADLHGQTVSGARAALGDEAFEAAWWQGLTASPGELQAGLAALDEPPASAGPAPSPAAAAQEPSRRPARRRGAAAATAGRGAGGGPLRIRALGAAAVHCGDELVTAADWGYAKPRELLFLLVASPPLTRDQVGAALWPDQLPDQLRNALHTALRGLRRALGDPEWIVYSGGRYAFNTGREHECDVLTFEQALTAARAARPAAAALPELQRAIGAYGGDFLDGMTAGEWAAARRDELSRGYESALLAAGRLHAAAGRYQPAVVAFRRAVAHEPLNETAHRELMTCWARLGETARAIHHYEVLTELLTEQVGVGPAKETAALYRQLRGGQ